MGPLPSKRARSNTAGGFHPQKSSIPEYDIATAVAALDAATMGELLVSAATRDSHVATLVRERFHAVFVNKTVPRAQLDSQTGSEDEEDPGQDFSHWREMAAEIMNERPGSMYAYKKTIDPFYKSQAYQLSEMMKDLKDEIHPSGSSYATKLNGLDEIMKIGEIICSSDSGPRARMRQDNIRLYFKHAGSFKVMRRFVNLMTWEEKIRLSQDSAWLDRMQTFCGLAAKHDLDGKIDRLVDDLRYDIEEHAKGVERAARLEGPRLPIIDFADEARSVKTQLYETHLGFAVERLDEVADAVFESTSFSIDSIVEQIDLRSPFETKQSALKNLADIGCLVCSGSNMSPNLAEAIQNRFSGEKLARSMTRVVEAMRTHERRRMRRGEFCGSLDKLDGVHKKMEVVLEGLKREDDETLDNWISLRSNDGMRAQDREWFDLLVDDVSTGTPRSGLSGSVVDDVSTGTPSSGTSGSESPE